MIVIYPVVKVTYVVSDGGFNTEEFEDRKEAEEYMRELLEIEEEMKDCG